MKTEVYSELLVESAGWICLFVVFIIAVIVTVLRWALRVNERSRYLYGIHQQSVGNAYRIELVLYHLERIELLARGYRLEEAEATPVMPEKPPQWETFQQRNKP
jgi:hypothetical protein